MNPVLDAFRLVGALGATAVCMNIFALVMRKHGQTKLGKIGRASNN